MISRLNFATTLNGKVFHFDPPPGDLWIYVENNDTENQMDASVVIEAITQLVPAK